MVGLSGCFGVVDFGLLIFLMRVVIQKVISANAKTTDGQIISSIGRGLCVLVGISRSDTAKDLDYIVNKILNLKLFEDDDKRWKKSVKETSGEILCLSQITLYHSLKGNKVDFHRAMAPSESAEFYSRFVSELRNRYCSESVKEGIFGEHLIIGIENDGPVTISLESPANNDNEEQTVPDVD